MAGRESIHHDEPPTRMSRWGTGIVLLCSAVYFLLFFSPFASPDESTALLVQHLSLFPLRPPSSPLWHWVVLALTGLGVKPLAFLPNLFSVVCGAGSVALLYRLVSRTRFPADWVRHAPALPVYAGLAAAIALATAPSFWRESLRAHPAAFDMLLLLGSLNLLLQYRDTGRLAWAFGFAVVYGMAIPELATLILLAPFLGIYLLYLAHQHGQLRAGAGLGFLAASLLPMAVVYGLAALDFAGSPTAWPRVDGFWPAVWQCLLAQWHAIAPPVRAFNILMVLLSGFVPWMVGYLILKRVIDREEGGYMVVLHAVLTLWVLAILFQFSFLSPWKTFGITLLMVVPYVFAAAATGYVVAYWIGVAGGWRANLDPPRPAPMVIFRVILVLLALVLTSRNRAASSTAGNKDWHGVVKAMLHGVDGRSLLLTEGLVDASLLVEARDAGVKLDVVNLYLSKIEAYRTYVAELAGSPRAQALAQLALPLYMGEMLRGDTNITARLGVQAGPEAWIDYGINPVPYKWLYLGARARTEYEPARLAQENQAFWDEVKPLLQRLRRVEARRGLPVSRVSAQFARVANDFGIWCEEAPDAEAAERAYRTALELWPGNVSALLNLQQILARAGKTNEVASMKEPVEKAVLGARNLRIPGIARTYGHIRSRESLDRLLAIWKTPVVKPAWEDQIPRITDLLTRKELPAARRALETLIQQYPEAEQAWILLAAVAFDTQDDKLMERCVEQMRKQRREWPQVLMLLGEQAIRRGDVTTAMQYAERVAQLWPANARVLEFMLARHLEDRDFNKVELRVSLLLAVDPENTMANFSLGLLMLQKDQKKLAEDAFRHALKRDRHVPAINNLAWLLAETGRWSEAIPLAREATELAPQSPDVWDTLGYAYLVAGQYPEAESALVRAMELGPRHLSARCRYAVVLQRTGRVAEARKEAESILNGPDKLEPDQVRSLREILYAGSPPAGG